MHNQASVNPRGEDLEKFYVHLASGLHAMAQPLTILRSSVAASIVPGITPERHERYLGISIQQVERACSLFESLQDLVISKQVEAAASPIDVGQIAAEAVAAQMSLPRAAEISIELRIADDLRPAMGDRGRTGQALDAALKVAVALSTVGDTVEVFLNTRERSIECSVQNRKPHGKSVDSSQQLILALAEINISSQQGHFDLSVDPLRVRLILPAAPARE